ncbi:MAG: stage V sporulation protein AE [Ruminococcus sp.]|nr:stage V sporulation protein AE [Ruminococcus sp.]
MQYLYAFLAGGALCLIGQVLIDKTRLTPARILTGYVVMGVLLSALGLYTPFADFAGAGASVPLSGFGHLMAQGVRDAIDEQGAIGILTGAFSAASAGIGAAILFSLLAGIISKPKEK